MRRSGITTFYKNYLKPYRHVSSHYPKITVSLIVYIEKNSNEKLVKSLTVLYNFEPQFSEITIHPVLYIAETAIQSSEITTFYKNYSKP